MIQKPWIVYNELKLTAQGNTLCYLSYPRPQSVLDQVYTKKSELVWCTGWWTDRRSVLWAPETHPSSRRCPESCNNCQPFYQQGKCNINRSTPSPPTARSNQKTTCFNSWKSQEFELLPMFVGQGEHAVRDDPHGVRTKSTGRKIVGWPSGCFVVSS